MGLDLERGSMRAWTLLVYLLIVPAGRMSNANAWPAPAAAQMLVGGDLAFETQIVFWLWLTVLFGNCVNRGTQLIVAASDLAGW